MTKIKNKENIKQIIMKPTACTLCAIGQDWFNSEFVITFIPNEYYPDYMQVQDWIMTNIDGKEMNIETAANEIYKFIEKEYAPKALTVENHVNACKSHFPVIVTR